MDTWLIVLLVVLAVVVAAVVALYFVGSKLQTRQTEQQALLESMAQTVSMLIIDKKKLKMAEAGLPKMVMEQAPKYMRRFKMPIVKAKVGPKVMTLICMDEAIFQMIPVKTEIKAVVSGIYITKVKSIRGGAVPTLPKKKKGLLSRFKKDKKAAEKK